MGRTARPFPCQTFQDLYHKGYTDQQIAAKIGFSRSQVYRHREKLGLPSHRGTGQRGCSVSQYTPFWLQARRWMRNPEVAKAIRGACDELRRDPDIDFNYLDSAMVWVFEPGPVVHPVPGPYEQRPEKMNANIVERILQYEEFLDRSAGSTGVPGLAIVDLVCAIKSKEVSEEQKAAYARRAVLEAGLTSAYATVGSLEKGSSVISSPATIGKIWAKAKSKCLEWVSEITRSGREIAEIRKMFSSAGVSLDQNDAVVVYDEVKALLHNRPDLSVVEVIKENPMLVAHAYDPEVDKKWIPYQAAVHSFVRYWSLPETMRPKLKAEKISWSERILNSDLGDSLAIRRNQAFLAARGY